MGSFDSLGHFPLDKKLQVSSPGRPPLPILILAPTQTRKHIINSPGGKQADVINKFN